MSFILSSLPSRRRKYISTAESGHALAPTPLNTWIRKVSNNGGIMGTNSISIATDLLANIQGESYYSKIISLWPFLGTNLAAFQVPLIDVLNVGLLINHSFVDADCNESSGIQGNGSSKYFDTGIKPSQLGVGNNGGLGWWEGNFVGSSNSEPIGCYSSSGAQRFVLDFRTTVYFFPWGAPGNNAAEAVSAGNHHVYGNRDSDSSRRLFKDGVFIQNNTTTDTASGAGDTNIALMGSLEPGVTPYNGLCKVAYLTDGTFSDAEALAWHTALDTYLITPTGR